MNSLAEMTKDELFCVMKELASKANCKSEAFLTAIGKLRRHWELRYETVIPPHEALKLETVIRAFEESGKLFPEDAGFVVVNIVNDPYRASDYVELDVLVFGKEGYEGNPVFYTEIEGEARTLAARSMGEVGWVGPALVRSLFDEKLLCVLAERGLPISVNPNHLTDMKLDPLNGAEDMPVYAELK